MKKYILKIRWLLLGSVVLSSVHAILNALMLLFPGWLVDGYQNGFPYVAKLLAAYAVIFVAYLVNAYFSNRAADYRRITFEQAVKKDFFNAVMQRDFPSFHKYDIGEYISMQAADITEMCMNYLNPLFFILDAVVTIIIFGVSLFVFVNSYITIAILFFSAAIVFVPQLTAKHLSKRNKTYLDSVGQYTAAIKTLYESHEILDRSGRKTIMTLHEKELDTVMRHHMHFRRLNSFALVLNGGSVDILSLIVFVMVAILLLNGRITLGMATIAFTYSTKFMVPMYQLNTEIGSVLSVQDIKKKLLTILRVKDSATDEDAQDVGIISSTALEKNYDGAKIRIPSTQLTYPEKYLVVGENGAGKSVFFRLLMHFEEADQGHIFYNGQERKSGISESICYVPQTPVIFQSSYEDNVTIYGTYSRERLAEYETYFPQSIIHHIKNNTDPENLSGGEKQVIALLRALCSEKPVLLLDEPFAAMNQLTIESFMGKLQKIDRMLVIIAHNVDDYVEQFDETIVIKR